MVILEKKAELPLKVNSAQPSIYPRFPGKSAGLWKNIRFPSHPYVGITQIR